MQLGSGVHVAGRGKCIHEQQGVDVLAINKML